jgi:hypothetical protein
VIRRSEKLMRKGSVTRDKLRKSDEAVGQEGQKYGYMGRLDIEVKKEDEVKRSVKEIE